MKTKEFKETVNEIPTNGKSELSDFVGTWKLEYKTINTLGEEAFGGKILTAYEHPRTFKTVPRLNPNGKTLSHLMISKLITLFNPEENRQERLDVEWMVHHPEVKIQGYDKLPEIYQKAKQDDAQLTLIAVDYQEQVEIEEEDFIDKVVSIISLDGGPQALSLQKIKYILAELGQIYNDIRYMNNNKIEKKSLKAKLKTFVKRDYKNAKSVNIIINNIENAKLTYELKEMMRLKIITESNGMFKYDHLPLGVSIVGILSTWEKEPDLKMTMQKELNSKLKK